ncbi:hypothetical protein H9P43_004485 [Blastocladiella emersonii ATCC 22665]|nr:hypothetical protein H9P43_004485 [Blastocladiella emersonii ATCC 22665]
MDPARQPYDVYVDALVRSIVMDMIDDVADPARVRPPPRIRSSAAWHARDLALLLAVPPPPEDRRRTPGHSASNSDVSDDDFDGGDDERWSGPLASPPAMPNLPPASLDDADGFAPPRLRTLNAHRPSLSVRASMVLGLDLDLLAGDEPPTPPTPVFPDSASLPGAGAADVAPAAEPSRAGGVLADPDQRDALDRALASFLPPPSPETVAAPALDEDEVVASAAIPLPPSRPVSFLEPSPPVAALAAADKVTPAPSTPLAADFALPPSRPASPSPALAAEPASAPSTESPLSPPSPTADDDVTETSSVADSDYVAETTPLPASPAASHLAAAAVVDPEPATERALAFDSAPQPETVPEVDMSAAAPAPAELVALPPSPAESVDGEFAADDGDDAPDALDAPSILETVPLPASPAASDFAAAVCADAAATALLESPLPSPRALEPEPVPEPAVRELDAEPVSAEYSAEPLSIASALDSDCAYSVLAPDTTCEPSVAPAAEPEPTAAAEPVDSATATATAASSPELTAAAAELPLPESPVTLAAADSVVADELAHSDETAALPDETAALPDETAALETLLPLSPALEAALPPSPILLDETVLATYDTVLADPESTDTPAVDEVVSDDAVALDAPLPPSPALSAIACGLPDVASEPDVDSVSVPAVDRAPVTTPSSPVEPASPLLDDVLALALPQSPVDAEMPYVAEPPVELETADSADTRALSAESSAADSHAADLVPELDDSVALDVPLPASPDAASESFALANDTVLDAGQVAVSLLDEAPNAAEIALPASPAGSAVGLELPINESLELVPAAVEEPKSPTRTLGVSSAAACELPPSPVEAAVFAEEPLDLASAAESAPDAVPRALDDSEVDAAACELPPSPTMSAVSANASLDFAPAADDEQESSESASPIVDAPEVDAATVELPCSPVVEVAAPADEPLDLAPAAEEEHESFGSTSPVIDAPVVDVAALELPSSPVVAAALIVGEDLEVDAAARELPPSPASVAAPVESPEAAVPALEEDRAADTPLPPSPTASSLPSTPAADAEEVPLPASPLVFAHPDDAVDVVPDDGEPLAGDATSVEDTLPTADASVEPEQCAVDPVALEAPLPPSPTASQLSFMEPVIARDLPMCVSAEALESDVSEPAAIVDTPSTTPLADSAACLDLDGAAESDEPTALCADDAASSPAAEPAPQAAAALPASPVLETANSSDEFAECANDGAVPVDVPLPASLPASPTVSEFAADVPALGDDAAVDSLASAPPAEEMIDPDAAAVAPVFEAAEPESAVAAECPLPESPTESFFVDDAAAAAKEPAPADLAAPVELSETLSEPIVESPVPDAAVLDTVATTEVPLSVSPVDRDFAAESDESGAVASPIAVTREEEPASPITASSVAVDAVDSPVAASIDDALALDSAPAEVPLPESPAAVEFAEAALDAELADVATKSPSVHAVDEAVEMDSPADAAPAADFVELPVVDVVEGDEEATRSIFVDTKMADELLDSAPAVARELSTEDVPSATLDILDALASPTASQAAFPADAAPALKVVTAVAPAAEPSLNDTCSPGGPSALSVIGDYAAMHATPYASEYAPSKRDSVAPLPALDAWPGTAARALEPSAGASSLSGFPSPPSPSAIFGTPDDGLTLAVPDLHPPLPPLITTAAAPAPSTRSRAASVRSVVTNESSDGGIVFADPATPVPQTPLERSLFDMVPVPAIPAEHFAPVALSDVPEEESALSPSWSSSSPPAGSPRVTLADRRRRGSSLSIEPSTPATSATVASSTSVPRERHGHLVPSWVEIREPVVHAPALAAPSVTSPTPTTVSMIRSPLSPPPMSPTPSLASSEYSMASGRTPSLRRSRRGEILPKLQSPTTSVHDGASSMRSVPARLMTPVPEEDSGSDAGSEVHQVPRRRDEPKRQSIPASHAASSIYQLQAFLESMPDFGADPAAEPVPDPAAALADLALAIGEEPASSSRSAVGRADEMQPPTTPAQFAALQKTISQVEDEVRDLERALEEVIAQAPKRAPAPVAPAAEEQPLLSRSSASVTSPTHAADPIARSHETLLRRVGSTISQSSVLSSRELATVVARSQLLTQPEAKINEILSSKRRTLHQLSQVSLRAEVQLQEQQRGSAVFGTPPPLTASDAFAAMFPDSPHPRVDEAQRVAYERRRDTVQGKKMMNVSPGHGIKYLVDRGILPNPDAPPAGANDEATARYRAECARRVAEFLLSEQGLSKTSVGRLLGQANVYSRLILREYFVLFHLDALNLEQALRSALMHFRLPSEANVIYRIAEELARQWYNQNRARIAAAMTLAAAQQQQQRGTSEDAYYHREVPPVRAPSPSHSLSVSIPRSRSPLHGPAAPSATAAVPASSSSSFLSWRNRHQRDRERERDYDDTSVVSSSLARVDDPMSAPLISPWTHPSLPRSRTPAGYVEWWWTPETAHVLSIALIMLNTDLHSPANRHKMKRRQFAHNTLQSLAPLLAGHVNLLTDGDVSLTAYLKGVYDSMHDTPLSAADENEFFLLYKYFQEQDDALRAEFHALFGAAAAGTTDALPTPPLPLPAAIPPRQQSFQQQSQPPQQQQAYPPSRVASPPPAPVTRSRTLPDMLGALRRTSSERVRTGTPPPPPPQKDGHHHHYPSTVHRDSVDLSRAGCLPGVASAISARHRATINRPQRRSSLSQMDGSAIRVAQQQQQPPAPAASSSLLSSSRPEPPTSPHVSFAPYVTELGAGEDGSDLHRKASKDSVVSALESRWKKVKKRFSHA